MVGYCHSLHVVDCLFVLLIHIVFIHWNLLGFVVIIIIIWTKLIDPLN